MALGRSLACSLALLPLLTGCAATQNTVAQDLAWERWQMWVWVADGGEQTAWRACDSAARAEQAKGSAAIPPGTTTVLSPSNNGALQAPVWKSGYEWGYRYESPA